METTTKTDNGQNIRTFNQKLKIETPNGFSSEVKFDKFDKDVKLFSLDVQLWETVTETDAQNNTITYERAILETNPNRERIMLRLATESDEVKISGNQAEALKYGNVFSIVRLFSSWLFRGWRFPKNSKIALTLSHSMEANVTSKLGFPIIATIVAGAELLDGEN